MKKLLYLLSVAALMIGCGLIPDIPDIEGIEDMIRDSLEMTVEPKDQGVDITIVGFPEELPEGLEGISVYVTENDITDLSYTVIGDPIVSGLTHDTTISGEGLINGDDYFAEGRGEIGDSVSTLGFGGKFYPRPWGQGEYLGYDPEDDSAKGYSFGREDGLPVLKPVSEGVDVQFEMREGPAYAALEFYAVVEGEDAGIKVYDGSDEWLGVQDWDEGGGSYAPEVMLEGGTIYQFMTEGGYYGKFEVDSVKVISSAFLADELKVWLKYAFQTAQHVGHY